MDPSYRYRASLFRDPVTFTLTRGGLAWSRGSEQGTIAYSDMRRIRIYELPDSWVLPNSSRCVVEPAHGRAQVLSSTHFAGMGRMASQIAEYRPFVDELLKRAAAENPRIAFVAGMSMPVWVAYHALFALGVIVPLAAAITIASLGWGASENAGSILGLIAIAFLIVPMWQVVGRNGPRPFDPKKGYPL